MFAIHDIAHFFVSILFALDEGDALRFVSHFGVIKPANKPRSFFGSMSFP